MRAWPKRDVMPGLIIPLVDGPLDIVGDVHGEVDALSALLDALGYRQNGVHPQDRRLVFVGDLCDRGPDSPAVIEMVRALVENDRAQCVLGNHELNLLRGDEKHGNRWFLDPHHDEQRFEFRHCTAAPVDLKPAWHEFFLSMPLALERRDLRVAHAEWHESSITKLRSESRTALDVFEDYERRIEDELEMSGLNAAAQTEKSAHAPALETESTPVPLLPSLGRRDELLQMGNPVRVVTSGAERATTKPFWANGKWRMCDRVPWWDEYTDAIPVIVGHYWRIAQSGNAQGVSDGKPNMFESVAFNEWCGAERNVYCVDFSVGGRYRERARSVAEFSTRLAAVRWPEREIVFDDRSTSRMIP